MFPQICRATISAPVRSLLKAPIVPRINKLEANRLFGSEGRTAYRRSVFKTKQETVFRGESPAIPIGKGFVAGSAVIGLGALCYYGAGLSENTGAIDHAAFWPEYVKDRIHTTYMYVGGSIATSAATAAACFRSPAVMNILSRGGLIAFGVSMAALIGSSTLAHNIPYQEGFGAKQMAWLLHSGVVGAVIAPLSFVGGPLIIRAACYTAGIVGGLSAIAVCAPSEKFLNIGGPLAIGLGVVFASSIASMFLSPTTMLGSSVYSIVLYGGLVLFSMKLLYDTQRIIRSAETHPVTYRQFDYNGNAVRAFDPINHSISLFMDTINIFVRMVMILGNGGSRKK